MKRPSPIRLKTFLTSEHREMEISDSELHMKLMNLSNIRLYISKKGEPEIPDTTPLFFLQDPTIQLFPADNHRVLIWLLVCRFDHKEMSDICRVVALLSFLKIVYFSKSVSCITLRVQVSGLMIYFFLGVKPQCKILTLHHSLILVWIRIKNKTHTYPLTHLPTPLSMSVTALEVEWGLEFTEACECVTLKVL